MNNKNVEKNNYIHRLNEAIVFLEHEFNRDSNLNLHHINHLAWDIVLSQKKRFTERLACDILDGNYKPEKTFEVYRPKKAFIHRPVYALSTTDRLVYQFLVSKESLGGAIENALLPCVYGNRVTSEKNTFLAHYTAQWNKFHKDQAAAWSDGYTWLVKIDIETFFERIDHGRLVKVLRTDFPQWESEIQVLNQQLGVWYSPCSTGLPQGPDASWPLANYYLHDFDLWAKGHLRAKGCYFRYADDIVFLVKNEKDAKDMLTSSSYKLAEIGLSLNQNKTKIEHISSVSDLRNRAFAVSERGVFRGKRTLNEEMAHSLIKSIAERVEVLESDRHKLHGFLKYHPSKVGRNFYFDLITALKVDYSLVGRADSFLQNQLLRVLKFEHEALYRDVLEELIVFAKSEFLRPIGIVVSKIVLEVIQTDEVEIDGFYELMDQYILDTKPEFVEVILLYLDYLKRKERFADIERVLSWASHSPFLESICHYLVADIKRFNAPSFKVLQNSDSLEAGLLLLNQDFSNTWGKWSAPASRAKESQGKTILRCKTIAGDLVYDTSLGEVTLSTNPPFCLYGEEGKFLRELMRLNGGIYRYVAFGITTKKKRQQLRDTRGRLVNKFKKLTDKKIIETHRQKGYSLVLKN